MKKIDEPLADASIKLIGHSGPVFGSSFGHDKRYLISCSEDTTGIFLIM